MFFTLFAPQNKHLRLGVISFIPPLWFSLHCALLHQLLSTHLSAYGLLGLTTSQEEQLDS